MQELITKFVREMLAQKNLKGIDPKVVEKLVANLSQELNDQINRAIIDQLDPGQMDRFEDLLAKKPTNQQIQEFFDSTDIDTAKTAAEVMKAFRAGYLGQ